MLGLQREVSLLRGVLQGQLSRLKGTEDVSHLCPPPTQEGGCLEATDVHCEETLSRWPSEIIDHLVPEISIADPLASLYPG